jgi:hypothetical protein
VIVSGGFAVSDGVLCSVCYSGHLENFGVIYHAFVENYLYVHPLVLGFYLIWATISLIKQHMDENCF